MATSKETLAEIDAIQLKIMDYAKKRLNKVSTLPKYDNHSANNIKQCLIRRGFDDVVKNQFGDKYFLTVTI